MPQCIDSARGMGPRLRGDDSKSLLPRRSISPIQFSNSQRSAPVFFVEAPGRPVVSLSPMRGDGAPGGATNSPAHVALTCLCDRHVSPDGAPSRLFCPRDRASGRGHLIQAAFAALHPRLVQPLKAAPRSWSGQRRPGASRRRGCETTPAGAASDPARHDAS